MAYGIAYEENYLQMKEFGLAYLAFAITPHVYDWIPYDEIIELFRTSTPNWFRKKPTNSTIAK